MPNYITTLKMPNDDVYVIKDEAAQTLIESIKNGYFGNLVHQVDANGNVYNFYKKNDNTTVLATITLATTVTSTGDAANNPVTSGAVASAISDMASATDLSTLTGRVTTVENNYNALMNNADAEKVINSFNEVVAFLAGVTTDDTLIGKLNDLNSGKLADVKIESGKLKKKYTDTGGYDSGTNVVTDVQVGSTSVVSNGVASITLPTWSSLKPSGGIPSTDLASGVQTLLGKADSAVQGIKKNGKTLTLDSNKIVDISDVVTTVKMNNTTLTLSKNSSTGAGEIDLGTVVKTVAGSNDTAVAPNSAGNLKVNLTGSYANETLTLNIAVTAPST